MLGNVNYFGGPNTGCAKYDEKMKKAEEKEAMFVIVSDLWLDKVKVNRSQVCHLNL